MKTQTHHFSDLAIFARVAELMSFTAAADQLGIDRSVASKAVTRIEQHLNVRLMHRTTRRLALTDAGERLYNRIASAFAEIRAAEREIAPRRTTPGGTLRLTLPMSFGLLHVAPLLPDFMQRYPDVRLELTFEDRQSDVVAGGFDLALRIAKLESSTLVARRIARVHQVLVAAPSYVARHGAPAVPADLTAHRSLVYLLGNEPGLWTFTDEQQQQHRVRVQPVMSANNTLALREALRAGVGLAVLPRFYAAEDLSAGRLQLLLTNYALPELALHAVMPTRKHVPPSVRALIDFLIARFGDPPYWDRH